MDEQPITLAFLHCCIAGCFLSARTVACFFLASSYSRCRSFGDPQRPPPSIAIPSLPRVCLCAAAAFVALGLADRHAPSSVGVPVRLPPASITLGLGRISHSIIRSSPLSRSPVNVASIAPSPVNSKNVNNVGLKDAPLQSLFPAEPKPPAPVGHLHVPTAHAWRHGASFGHRPVLLTHMSFVSDPLLRASSNSAWLGGMGLAPSR